MPRLSRVVLPGHAHHVTQRGVRSQPVFFEDDDRRLYLSLLKEQMEKTGVRILCYCLMDNHTHLIAVPPTAEALARCVGETHRRYTVAVNRRLETRGYLFQGRFSSCALDETHLITAAAYVLLNPVRAGLVAEAREWPWSSAVFHLGAVKKDPVVANPDLLGEVPNVRAWRQILESGQVKDREIAAYDGLRLATRTGRPWGSEKLFDTAEEQMKRRVRVGARGRPRLEK